MLQEVTIITLMGRNVYICFSFTPPFVLCSDIERDLLAGAEQTTQYANNYLDSNLRSVIQCHNLHNTPGCWQNKQITRCETGLQLLRHHNSLFPDDPDLAWSDHTRHSANVMTQEIYCGHKNGEIGSGSSRGGRGTQSDLALSGATLVSGIQEVVSNKSGDHSHNL